MLGPLVPLAPVAAQRRAAPPPAVTPAPIEFAARASRPSVRDLARHAWVKPAASLLVPGAGQLLGRQDRGAVYLAAELWLAARAIALTNEARRDRSAFQDLAYSVARYQFGGGGPRRDGSFEYYENMTHYVESGEFDRHPGPALEPESDTLTFNGAVWLLARRTFLPNPDSLPAPESAPYQTALAYYSRRAVQGDFRWSWRDARLEQDVFKSQIRSSDDAFRTATNYLGALVLNHLGSAIDALITIRVGERPAAVPLILPGATPGAVLLAWSRSF